MTTPLSTEIDHRLQERHQQTLTDLVRQMRVAGKGWRVIAAQVRDLTEVYVSYETLRSWFLDDVVHVTRTLATPDRVPGD
jgi:hypothetical protein